MFSHFKNILKYTIHCFCLSHCAFEYVGDIVVCNGPSMEPTLYSKNVLLTERISTRCANFDRGDVIIAVSPHNPSQHICKRIVGLPGDKIVATSPAIAAADDAPQLHYLNADVVPRGHVWIEGDNKDNSSDSRFYGPIPQGLIKSRALIRIWPFEQFKVL